MSVIGRTVEWDPSIQALYKPLSLSEAGMYEQMNLTAMACVTLYITAVGLLWVQFRLLTS